MENAAPLREPPFRAGPLVYMSSMEEYRERCAAQADGDLYGLPLPKVPEDLVTEAFGPAWLTKAFRLAGSLPEDNEVVAARLKRFTKRPGGSGPKAILDLEYAKADESLETRLFVKMPYTLEENEDQRVMEGGRNACGDIWGGEVHFYRWVSPHMPFPVPRFYFGDFSRRSADAVLIISAIPFPESDSTSAGAFGPYEILPTTGKAEDFRYEGVHEYYLALCRSLGTMAGYDKLGKLGPYQGDCKKMGHLSLDVAADYGAETRTSTPEAPCLWWSWYGPHLGEYGQGYASPHRAGLNGFYLRHFIERVAPHIFPPEMREKAWLAKMTHQMVVISRLLQNIGRFAYSDPRYVALLNMNANSDNAFFWRRADGALEAGLLDFAATGKMSFPQAFHGMFTSALGEMVADHEDRFVEAFAEAYHATGAPALDVERLRLLLRVSTCGAVYGMIGMVGTWLGGARGDRSEHWKRLQNYSDPLLAKEFSFNDKFMTSMFYQHAVLWWKRGDVYYEALLKWAREDLQLPFWHFWSTYGRLELFLDWGYGKVRQWQQRLSERS